MSEYSIVPPNMSHITKARISISSLVDPVTPTDLVSSLVNPTTLTDLPLVYLHQLPTHINGRSIYYRQPDINRTIEPQVHAKPIVCSPLATEHGRDKPLPQVPLSSPDPVENSTGTPSEPSHSIKKQSLSEPRRAAWLARTELQLGKRKRRIESDEEDPDQIVDLSTTFIVNEPHTKLDELDHIHHHRFKLREQRREAIYVAAGPYGGRMREHVQEQMELRRKQLSAEEAEARSAKRRKRESSGQSGGRMRRESM